jgi:putative zinc finger/helix-turn-helix YgiT family protein
MHCLNCNHLMKKITLARYAYDACGLPLVTVHNTEKFECPSCGDEMTSFTAIADLHRAIAVAIAMKHERLSAYEVRFLRDSLGMTNQAFARAMGVTQHQTSRWTTGAPISATAERLLRLLAVDATARSADEGGALVAMILSGTCAHGSRSESKIDAVRRGARWTATLAV